MTRLTRSNIAHFRNLEPQQSVWGPDVNLIVGANGSGKTSFLEALHVLATGKSFIGATAREFIARGQEKTSLFTEVCTAEGALLRLGVEKTRSTTEFRADGKSVSSASALAQLLRVVPMDSQTFQLLGESPARRRALLDRTLFHVEPDYLSAFRLFHRALQQRNQALKDAAGPQTLDFWSAEFVKISEVIHQKRVSCVRSINQWLDAHSGLAGLGRIAIEYKPGWRAGTSLEKALADGLAQDRQQKVTLSGPHRGELRITCDGNLARSSVSRGQGKTICCLLVEAQLACLEGAGCEPPVLLVDDLAAELDRTARVSVLEMLLKPGRQVFLTAIDAVDLPGLEALEKATMFHVKRGRLAPA